MGDVQPWIVGALLIGILLVIARMHVEVLEGLGRLYDAVARRMGMDVADPEGDSDDP